MFNIKFQLLLLCGLFTFLLMVCWPTSILACSSRSIIKPRPVAIEAPKTSSAAATTTIPIKIKTKTPIAPIILPKRIIKSDTANTGATSTRRIDFPTVSVATTGTGTVTGTSTRTITSTSTTAATTTTTTTTLRPNITFPTFKCPANYDAWYCLNEASCFTVKLGDSIMYNCECATGFMGPRCEYKELDGSFQPKRPRPILEKASIASGVACILLFLLFICLVIYLRYDQRHYHHHNHLQHHHHHHQYHHNYNVYNYDNCDMKKHRFEKCLHCLKIIQLNDENIDDDNYNYKKHSMTCHSRYPFIEAFPIGVFMFKRFHKI